MVGDFNLAFLDLIDEVDDLKWSGNCNELNAAYAADGSYQHNQTDDRIFACHEYYRVYCYDVWVGYLGRRLTIVLVS